jgi:MarR family transcriptional regulator, lower aerobic nicotinate degradation pathway regulator
MATSTSRAARQPKMPAGDERGLVDALAQLSFLIHGLLADTVAQYDLSIIQTRVLGVLRDRTPTMNELGRHLGLDKASISGLIDRAQRRGLVTRTVSTADRRSFEVSITDTGRELATHVTQRFEQRIQMLVSDLSPPDRQHLARLAGRLLTATPAIPPTE